MQLGIERTNPLFVIAALAVILACLVAAAAVTGLIPSAVSQRTEARSADALPGKVPAAPPCANCGTVEAFRQVQVSGSPSAWRITVRMDDESRRTVSQAELPALALGDKVRLVDGRAIALK